MDNTEVFFKVVRVALGDNRVYQAIKNIRGNPLRSPVHQDPPEENEE